MMDFKSFSFTAEERHDGMSVRNFLRRECGLTARSMTLLKYNENGLTRDGMLLRSNDTVHSGDVLTLRLPKDENDIPPVPGDLDILFEDDCLLIVNKPPFMPVHPTKVHQLDTLANIVSDDMIKKGERYAFRALNRIDKDTSGVVMIAKDRLTYAIVLPTIRKTYFAVCEGIITHAGTVDAPIALADDSKIRRCVHPEGQRAVTHYTPIISDNDHTLLRLVLETGRTHQIRCHLSSIGHPLAGDDLYGGSRAYINRQALHCGTVTFVHPFKKEMIVIETPVPSAFLALVQPII